VLNESLLQSLVVAWLIAGAAVLLVQTKFGSGSGLVAAYFLELIVLHWLAAAIYLVPGYYYLNPETIIDGLRESTYGFVGFCIGVLAATAWAYMRRDRSARLAPAPAVVDTKRLRTYLVTGVFSYLVLTPLFANFPTLPALANAASGFVVVGLALVCWNQAHHGSRYGLLAALLLVGLLPFATIAAQGFMGYGLAAAAVVFAFVASFQKASWRTVVGAGLAAYMGLTLYVTYMRDRSDIRDVVWGGSSIEARAAQIVSTFAEMEPFDPNNFDHLRRVDMRLNQNFLVGMAVHNLQTNPDHFANGRTLQDALIALVPRFLWPNKPTLAGSGNIVSDFTGIRFAEGTSVGVGMVMELYINFGSTGVLVGLVIFGFILASIDRYSAQARDAGQWATFALWFLPGVAMLQVGGSLVEVTSSAGAALLVAVLVARITDPRQLSGDPRRVGPRVKAELSRRQA